MYNLNLCCLTRGGSTGQEADKQLVVQVGFMQPHSRELIPLTFDSIQDRWQCPQVGAIFPWDGLGCEVILALTCCCDRHQGGWQTEEARFWSMFGAASSCKGCVEQVQRGVYQHPSFARWTTTSSRLV